MLTKASEPKWLAKAETSLSESIHPLA